MHISNVKIKNFRKITDHFNLDLSEGLNMLIGKNNLGKTAVIEAISECLSVGDISIAVRIVKDDSDDKNQPIENTPEKACEYIVNGKSAIEWILDRYQIKTDKASGITDSNVIEE